MTEGIEAVTTTMMGLALDAASLRQRVTAANIANVDTAGYVPMKVSFEAQMADVRRSLSGSDRLDSASIEAMQPRLEPALDVEVANMAQNAVQYQALVKGLTKHYAILSSAVSDGKK